MLAVFLSSALVVYSDYKHDDKLYLRRLLQTDPVQLQNSLADLLVDLLDTGRRLLGDLLTDLLRRVEQTASQSNIRDSKPPDRTIPRQADSSRKQKEEFGSFVRREI